MPRETTKAVVAPRQAAVEYTPDRVELLKRTICKGATDEELQLFVAQCVRTGLDPFAKQIHAVKRWDKKEKREVMSIQVGIDGFRLIAQRTGEFEGVEGPYWCGEDGVWVDVWLGKGPPRAAKVVAYRKGRKFPAVGIALWDEYVQTWYDSQAQQHKLTPFWERMPASQLAKCAEALALRRAFSQDLSGLYAPEEMREEGQAIEVGGNAKVVVTEQRPALAAPANAQKARDALAATFEQRIAAAGKDKAQLTQITSEMRASRAALGEDNFAKLGGMLKAVAVALAQPQPETMHKPSKREEQIAALLSSKDARWHAVLETVGITGENPDEMSQSEFDACISFLEAMPDVETAAA